jgi:hypothetical protein
MIFKRPASLRSLLGVVVIALSTMIVGVGPASAATFVVCDSWPAPSISASAGEFTAHYYHKCNTIGGVTTMAGYIHIVRDDGDGNRGNDIVVKTRQVVSAPQGEAAGTTVWAVGGNHGNYYAWEHLLFGGDITSGPAPHGGCGRPPGASFIECNWYSAAIFG